ncbi:hypothetical protein [Streptomyces sp. A0592]|uniref:hypothetical protein n=1 Tax=Streptomyces sp. A0592 TaxID=2563099 RepID=UPI00109EC98C|nr:hypothetical protein [Streptomyces sp. A0592]THA86325.1 hypothetical protein E6U81_04935 [Streptomyces sp. A0592]
MRHGPCGSSEYDADDARYATGYGSHPPLAAGELAGLADDHDMGSPEKTAECYDEGSVRQAVVLHFHDTGQTKHINVRVIGGGNRERWCVVMVEPDPKKPSPRLRRAGCV